MFSTMFLSMPNFSVKGIQKCWLIAGIFALLCTSHVSARTNEQAEFLQSAFTADIPAMSTLWLKSDHKQTLKQRYDYQLNRLRLRYWQQGQRSAWVLDEVGKEQPITMGVVIENNKIVSIDVLAYRESRGHEIKYPSFRKQFLGASIVEQPKRVKLDQRIDGITGATLSVRAMKKVAKVALYFHQLTVAAPLNE